jgi:hypothetical protein
MRNECNKGQRGSVGVKLVNHFFFTLVLRSNFENIKFFYSVFQEEKTDSPFRHQLEVNLHTNNEADGQTHRQQHAQTNRQTDRQTHRQQHAQTNRQTDTQTATCTNKQTDRQADTKTATCTNKQTDRQSVGQ